MLTPEQLRSTLETERQFRSVLLSAAKVTEPKPPSVWSGVGKLLLKAIPANVVRDAIVGGGKAILANRQRSADQDQPVPEATKQ